jgi:hypothetical protein
MRRKLMSDRPLSIRPWQNVVDAILLQRQANAQNC